MNQFSQNELTVFEKLFNLKNGNVLDFSREELISFIYDSIDIDINDEYLTKVKTYQYSTSRPQILRYILKNESDDKVHKLLSDLIKYIENKYKNIDTELLDKAKRIILSKSNHTSLIEIDTTEKDLFDLIEDINHHINANKPVFCVDRLHTLMTLYLKELCTNHGISFKDNDSLHELMKEYVKFINPETELSKTILKQSISLFSQFNNVRNNHTYSHGRNILNNAESYLIIRNVTSVLYFIQDIENIH